MANLPVEPSQSNSAILVTGGSGYVGSHLVRRLSKLGHTVVSMYRHRLPDPCTNVFPVCSDLSSEDLLAAPLRGVRTVVHLAWENVQMFSGVRGQNGSDSGGSVNVRSLQTLLAAMVKARTQRIILLSPIGASRLAESGFLQEKYRAEREVLNSAIPEKIIVRSAVVYGCDQFEGKFVHSIKRVMRFPGFYPLPFMKGKIYPLHVDDLVEAICNIANLNLDRCGSIIDIAGGEAYKVEEIFKLVASSFGGTRLPIHSVFGRFILPLFEQHVDGNLAAPRLRHFLSFGNLIEEKIRLKNPLVNVIPKRLKSFRDIFLSGPVG